MNVAPIPSSISNKLKSQWFSLTLIVLCMVAWAWPRLGIALSLDDWTKRLAICTIFFFSGLALRTEEVVRGFSRWPVHLYIQSFCFLFLPLCCWLVLAPWRETMPEGLLVGFYLLAVLPTTVTSCVVFSQLSGGVSSVALFNAVVGNMAGVVLSPTLLILMLGTGGPDIDLDPAAIFLKLCLLVVLPFVLGQVLHWITNVEQTAWPRRASLINSCCLLTIVYLVFSRTFAAGGWGGQTAAIIWPLAVLAPAHGLALGLASLGAKALGWSRAERITVLFCAPQKTLTLGVPLLAACLEANRPELLGLASLPMIVYHITQLIASGFLKDYLVRHAS